MSQLPAGLAPIKTPRQHPGARRLRRVAVAALAFVGIAVLLRLTLLRPKTVSVESAVVSRGTVVETVTNSRAGTVKTRQRASLSPETAGRVVALPHRKGVRVQAGVLLLGLDSALERAQVDLARESARAAAARVEEACLAARLAASEFGRGRDLQQAGIASDQSADQLDSVSQQAQAACRAAKATHEQAQAQLKVAEVELRRTELRAPFTGIIADIHTELGEWITPSPPGVPIPPVIEILDPRSIYIVAPIDEMDSERVHVGQVASLSVDSRRGEHFPGRLVRVAPYVLDTLEQNRTIEVEAEFDDPGVAQSLYPGTSADIEIILSRREGVLQVPTSAIGAASSVLAVERGRLVERAVKTGLRNWKTTEIVSGLSEGERVVTVRDSPGIRAGAAVVTGGER
jgi:HlyD family secretion protein